MKNQLNNELDKLDADIAALKLEAVAKEKEKHQWFLVGLVDASFTKEGHDKLKKEASEIKSRLYAKIKEATRVEEMLRVLEIQMFSINNQDLA